MLKDALLRLWWGKYGVELIKKNRTEGGGGKGSKEVKKPTFNNKKKLQKRQTYFLIILFSSLTVYFRNLFNDLFPSFVNSELAKYFLKITGFTNLFDLLLMFFLVLLAIFGIFLNKRAERKKALSTGIICQKPDIDI